MLKLILAFACAALTALLFASAAGADAISPESGPSRNAQEIDNLYKILLYMGVGVLAVVWGALFYSLIRYRGSRERSAPNIRGNVAIELAWTAVPVAIVITIIVITLLMLGDIKNPAASGPPALAQARNQTALVGQPPPPDNKGLEITVSAQQFLWRFGYPNGAVGFHDLVVPVNETVILDLEATDVAHSWWIPKLGGKADTLPTLHNKTWFKATETGSFTGQCAEFCGTGHSYMTARVVVVQPDQYRQYVSQLKRDIDQARAEQAKQAAQFQKEGI